MRSIIICTTLLLTTLSSAAEVPDKCHQTPVNGLCKAMLKKFYFNQKTGKCTPYFYDGCGPVVPFNTQEQCQTECETLLKKRPGSNLWHDAREDDPRYAEVFIKIDAEVDQALATHPQYGSMGFIHLRWETKKRILKQKYNIDWRSPAELNPQVMFD